MSIRTHAIVAFLLMATSLTAVRAQQPPQGQGGPVGGSQAGPVIRMRGRMDRGVTGREPIGVGAFDPAGFLNDSAVRERLGITTDQADKIRQQVADFRKAQIRNQADLRVKRIELGELLAADKPDRGAIDRKLQDVSNAQLALEKAAVNIRLNVRDLLTADQRQKLEQIRNELSQQRGQQRSPQGPGSLPGGIRERRMGPRGQNPPPPPQGQAPNR